MVFPTRTWGGFPNTAPRYRLAITMFADLTKAELHFVSEDDAPRTL
jgi:hypothetical protein